MKKHFYSLFAAVAMMLAVTSCSQEEDFAQSSSELTSFSISMDEVMGSRAIGDGLSATTLHYEVYHEDVRVIDSEETVESGKVNVELDLLNGEAYDIIFWAQAKDGSIYDVTDLKEIKVKYDNAENNKESYDAFYNALNGFEADGKTHKIELRRPFAQLNLGTTDWDAVKINGEGNPVTATSVTVKGLAETFAPLTGTATGSVEKTFAATKLSFTEEDDKFTVNSTEYKRLSLTYLLVPGTKAPQGEGDYTASDADGTDKALVDLTFNLKRGENDLQPIYVKDAPLQRNWRTNVIGALLTGSNFDVIIEEGLDNNHDVKGIDFDYLSTTMDADKDKEGDIVYSITGLGKESVDVNTEVAVTIPEEFKAKNVTFDFKDIKNGAKVNISSETYAGDVTLKFPNTEDNAIAEATIELPEGHVVLAQGHVTMGTVTTSPTTFVVTSGASFGTLTVDGGKVEIQSGGSVETVKAGEDNDEPIIVILGEDVEKPQVAEDTDVAFAGLNNTEEKNYVAQAGGYFFETLFDAIKAVEDGSTITLVADETFSETNRVNSSGSWYEGVYYVGDKSFTIDLGGFTISQDDSNAVNDYLLNFKNDGEKENVINLTNGTIEAKAAYCTIATSTTSTKKITINLENINLVGDNSNGAVIKIRGGAELNVKAGTTITGKDNYVGIECYGATVNVYDGSEFYMNGTTSYCGSLIGVSGNGLVNVYGGYGKGAKGGFIAMTSGGTINVSGGEWIANTDGTAAGDNAAVLIAQSQGGAKSIVNVAGGTFKGGYCCYGDAVGDAQINIKGGNFNADPSAYLHFCSYADKNNDNTWTVEQVLKEVGENSYEISSLAGLKVLRDAVNEGRTFEGCTITLNAEIDLNNEEWTPIGSVSQKHGFMGNFDGNGYAVKNLNIANIALDADGYAYAGLFGVTEGTDVNNENYIKNLTIENVTISTEGHIVAAAIAYPYYTNIENVTVKGNVNIKGGDYTSGVLAYTRRCVNAKDLTIEANEGSTIEGAQTVGGVISDIQMNGGLTANYSNFAASGLTVKATNKVGGISGIISGQSLDGATVKNVTIEGGDTRTGIVAGALGAKSNLTNVSYENVAGATRVIGATYDGGYYVGQIVEASGVKGIIYTIEDGVKAVSVAQGGEMNWEAAVEWAESLGQGWSLTSMDDLEAIHSVRVELNKSLAADSSDNVLFEEDNKEEDGSYAAYWSSDLEEGTTGATSKAYYKYFDNSCTTMKSFTMFSVEYSRAVYTIK